MLNRLAVPAFDVLARWRGARAFHPRGALFAGRVELTGTSSTVTALGGRSEHPALVRISKGVGTRGSRRDLLGLAVRLTDLPNGPVDLLFSTVGRLPVTRAFFSVVTGWCTRPYSTVLPYRADGDLVRLGLEPEDPHRARGTDPQAARAAVRRGPLQFTLVEKPRDPHRHRHPRRPDAEVAGRRSVAWRWIRPCPTARRTATWARSSPSRTTPWSTRIPGCDRCGRWPASARPRMWAPGAGGVPRNRLVCCPESHFRDACGPERGFPDASARGGGCPVRRVMVGPSKPAGASRRG